jgi:hypothetical protein
VRHSSHSIAVRCFAAGQRICFTVSRRVSAYVELYHAGGAAGKRLPAALARWRASRHAGTSSGNIRYLDAS